MGNAEHALSLCLCMLKMSGRLIVGLLRQSHSQGISNFSSVLSIQTREL